MSSGVPVAGPSGRSPSIDGRTNGGLVGALLRLGASPPISQNGKGWGMSHREQMRRALVDAAERVSIPAEASYVPLKGVMPDGSEVLVQCYSNAGAIIGLDTVHVCFRTSAQRTWGPPIELERAP